MVVAEVAEVVAKSMNGYLMFSRVLVAKVLAAEEVHALVLSEELALHLVEHAGSDNPKV